MMTTGGLTDEQWNGLAERLADEYDERMVDANMGNMERYDERQAMIQRNSLKAYKAAYEDKIGDLCRELREAKNLVMELRAKIRVYEAKEREQREELDRMLMDMAAQYSPL